ncbi:rhomboid family intramembrane serine protease [Lysobacter helvus]|uniref:Rhomboid family intramembrane serine protease n=2 Tax=Lysobacteraceae TaxID=32033 RepID=A0ABM7Q6U1_9GAMM|nr:MULTISPECIES: rhomboid family intramembrane serine protease [Lysobacter]BCT93051.1 rhomboid family intramembrane serine protease [Lysobacter caseinilyticus]BCT96203.1 rhomboid family intramembrane serine protease [Lysobacter helvus]
MVPRLIASIPRAVKALLIANALVFVLQLFANAALMNVFALWPLPFGVGGRVDYPPFMPWQLVSYAFLHGDFGHLFFNMLAVLMFGAQLEYEWREKRFITYWMLCIIGAGVCQLLMQTFVSPGAAIGASGGVYGLILAFAVKYPHQRVMMFPLPIQMSARTMAIGYAVAALLYGVFGSQEGVAHFAHLGGMLTGWIVLRYWRQEPPFGKWRRKKVVPKKKSHLRVVH